MYYCTRGWCNYHRNFKVQAKWIKTGTAMSNYVFVTWYASYESGYKKDEKSQKGKFKATQQGGTC